MKQGHHPCTKAIRQTAHLQSGTAQRVNILIVEDEEAVRRVLVRILERYFHCRVTTASTGEEALKIIAQEKLDHFSLAIIDVVLPKLSGQNVAVVLQECNPDISILFISGYNEECQTGHFENIEHFLGKPIGIEELTSQVGYMIGMPIKASV